LLAIVAGIEPAAPGFAKVRITPHLGPLTELNATLPHPLGSLIVSYHRTAHGISAEITLPKNLSGVFSWHGRTATLHAGRQKLAF
jgi:alpha-L-rhamnosidase